MSTETLFGQVAGNHSRHEENLATDALAYILRNKIAKRAFIEFVEQVGFKFDSNLSIHPQAHDDDKGVPDLIGKNKAGKSVLIVEAKFWAGLTGHQPASYMRKFSRNNKSVLIFLAPRLRLPSLWSEIIRLCAEEGYKTPTQENSDSEFLKAAITKNLNVAITSWRALLSHIQRALETEGLLDAASDVKQLFGLCERQDTEAFLPLKPEELSPEIGRRVYQYYELTDKVIKILDADNILVRGGLLKIKDIGEYGWYRKIGEYLCILEFNAYYWSIYRETPLWFCIRGERIKNQVMVNSKLRNLLKSMEREYPPRLLVDGDYFIIPLTLPTNVDENKVISSLVNQVKDIWRLVT